MCTCVQDRPFYLNPLCDKLCGRNLLWMESVEKSIICVYMYIVNPYEDAFHVLVYGRRQNDHYCTSFSVKTYQIWCTLETTHLFVMQCMQCMHLGYRCVFELEYVPLALALLAS